MCTGRPAHVGPSHPRFYTESLVVKSSSAVADRTPLKNARKAHLQYTVLVPSSAGAQFTLLRRLNAPQVGLRPGCLPLEPTFSSRKERM